MGGYIIHTPDGLSESLIARATELGPRAVGAPGSPGAMAREVGFISIDQIDVTDSFKNSCLAFRAARERLEEKLRELEGDEYFEEQCKESEGRLQGIEEGLLQRCLLIAVKP